jgi:hypothetical protein
MLRLFDNRLQVTLWLRNRFQVQFPIFGRFQVVPLPLFSQVPSKRAFRFWQRTAMGQDERPAPGNGDIGHVGAGRCFVGREGRRGWQPLSPLRSRTDARGVIAALVDG